MANKPLVVHTVKDLRAQVSTFRAAGERVALVPTMGALHAGHESLVLKAQEVAQRTVVSIFVNPAQFGPNEDFDRYPRTFDADLEKLTALGVDVVYAPSVAEMYPAGYGTRITVEGPSAGLESDFRPQFFTGVATVVGKLFLQCRPDCAIFGEKDYQQLMVLKRLARDLDLDIEVLAAPTLREADGLALSSRNAYLTPQERSLAPVIHEALSRAATAIGSGTNPEEAVLRASQTISTRGLKVDYVVARNAETLAPLKAPGEPVRLLAAAWLGTTRLIDNLPA
ncbi:pantoate--beta-alanine ligase [Xanthobacter sp. TB0136]|uniref:pantoate--beta-alanine ligase n=1 Tax=Xanthobacter sp. TB0136 TaxID=3459177 RepID=UPI0040394348